MPGGKRLFFEELFDTVDTDKKFKAEGRKSGKDITVFKSVGIAIQDLVVANEAYQKLTGESAHTT